MSKLATNTGMREDGRRQAGYHERWQMLDGYTLDTTRWVGNSEGNDAFCLGFETLTSIVIT